MWQLCVSAQTSVVDSLTTYTTRTYNLKPGSLYDWSNYWSKGIQFRSSVRADVPYCGMFTQLGQLHTIYHIW